MNAAEFLDGRPLDDGTWRFSIGRDRHGAFGGAFGGLLAACTVVAARSAAPGRRPVSLDARFLRALPAGDASVIPTVVHPGRSLTCVSVDVVDAGGRLATRSTIYLVEQRALRAVDHAGEGGEPPPSTAWSEGMPWRNPPRMEVPIVTTFAPRAVGRTAHWIGTALRVPWDEAGATPEAACLAADICVGPPVAGAFGRASTPAPNPDLSLRFTGHEAGPEVVGWGRLEGIAAGVATVGIEVRSGDALVGVGVSCSLLLSTD